MSRLIKFVPLLLLYVLIVAFFSKDTVIGDEGRFYTYVENLLNGFYTTSDDPWLMNGPGYPFYLYPFAYLGLPWIVPKFFNAILLLFAVWFAYRTLLYYCNEQVSLVGAYALGLYYPMYRWMVLNYSDILCLFLVCGAIYFTVKTINAQKIRPATVLTAGGFLGYLLLCKFIFIYVVVVALTLGLLYLFIRPNGFIKLTLAILGIAIMVFTPYLFYTYSITGKTFYLGTNGGVQLYWMSTKFENEYGSWHSNTTLENRLIPEMHPDHYAVYDTALTLNSLERNEYFQAVAIRNIKNNPWNYLSNIIPNLSRFFIGGPNSYDKQSLGVFFYAIPNLFLLYLTLFSFIPAWINRKHLPEELIGFVLFFLIYCGGSSLAVATPRYFIMVLPVLILWSTYLLGTYVKLKVLKV